MQPSSLRKKLFVSFSLLVILLILISSPASSQINFKVILHDIKTEPVAGQYANNLQLYVSVLDDQGAPIRDLKSENFTLLEDTKSVDFELEPVTDPEINLVLVVDTSGSMAGAGIQNARQAVLRFIDQMNAQDRIALISFSDEVKVVSDFTSDHASIQRQMMTLDAVPNGGTCLYDAVYKAIQLSSSLPEGRRGVLVLTDGRDELPNQKGKVCSSTTVDDSVHLAVNNIITPINAIGVGKEIDENSLQRLALLTGGFFLKSNKLDELDSLFQTMQYQIKNQYMLSYISDAALGDHNLTVRVTLGSAVDEDTRPIRLADSPPAIEITSPAPGGVIQTDTTIKLNLSGQSSAIARVEYAVNGTVLGESDSAPFDFDLLLADMPENARQLTAQAFDSQGKLLSQDLVDLNIQIPAATAEAQVKPTLEPVSASVEDTPASTPKSNQMILIIGIVVGILALLAVLVFILKPFKKAPIPVLSGPISGEETFDAVIGGDGRTGFSSGYSSGLLGILTVVFSDDPSRVGERIEIHQAMTHIGRSTTNEIVFPKDHPVSRNHAVLEYKDGLFQISEALTGDENGMKSPKFGTYVNEEKLYGSPMPVHSGDEIRLGNRLRLRFEANLQPYSSASNSEGFTMDGMM